MICVLNYLSSLAATTAAATASMRDLHYVIQQVEHFSDESLNSALWTAGIFIGVITLVLGVLAPILINRNAARKFKKKLAKAEKRINAIEGRFQIDADQRKEEIKRQAEKVDHKVNASLRFSVGLAMQRPDLMPEAKLFGAQHYLRASLEMLLAEDYGGFLDLMSLSIATLQGIEPLLRSGGENAPIFENIRRVQEDFIKVQAEHADVVTAWQNNNPVFKQRVEWFLKLGTKTPNTA